MTALQVVKRVAYGTAWRSGTLAALRWLNRGRLPILCYHSIVDRLPAPWDDVAARSGGLHLPVTQFRRQLELLARHYRVVSLDGAVTSMRRGEPLADRSVALTFDDGYANNVALAAPLLAEFGFPATIFLATGYVGRSLFWWDDPRAQLASRRALLRAATLEQRGRLLDSWGPDPGPSEALRPATWDECRAAPAGIQFGGHGATHRLLGEVSPGEARAELDDCQRALRAALGARAVPVFCYPAGQSTEHVRQALPAAGFRAAVVAGPQRADQRLAGAADELALLPRVGVTDRMTLAAFAARLAGV